MDNYKAGHDEGKITDTTNANEENPNLGIHSAIITVGEEGESTAVVMNLDNNRSLQSTTTRTPFTNLSQVDADLALARRLQEQERAYMMLRMNGDRSEYGSWETRSYVHEENDEFDDPSGDEYDGSDVDDDEDDAFDVHAHTESEEDTSQGVEIDSADFPSDEAFASALQDAEDREMPLSVRRLIEVFSLQVVAEEAEDSVDQGGNSQGTWEDVDPDELSYEELLALGEVVGTESRGLSADSIASLPSLNYKMQSSQDGSSDSCVICRLDYEDGDTLTVLSCKHSYHSECITNWLQINKVCPVCSAEVTASTNS